MIAAADESDALDLGTHFEGDRRTFDLQVFDQHDRITVGQHIAIGVLDDGICAFAGIDRRLHRPLMTTVTTDVIFAVRIGVLESTLGAGWDGRHGGFQMEGNGTAQIITGRVRTSFVRRGASSR